jgi:hypothetical protein
MFITKNNTKRFRVNQGYTLHFLILLPKFVLHLKARVLIKVFSSNQIPREVQTYSAKKFNFLAVAAILTVLLAAPLTRAQTEKQSKSKMPQKRNVQKSMTINTTNEEKSLDMVIKSLYSVISGPAGQKRDVGKLKTLLHPQIRHSFIVVPPQSNSPELRVFGLDDFLVFTTPIWEKGFFEQEIFRKTERYGNLVHVLSTYQMRETENGTVLRRGINSFQYFYDGTKWLMISAFWQGESDKIPIPSKYLPTSCAP